MKYFLNFAYVVVFLSMFPLAQSFACGCGCSVFSVGDMWTMMPPENYRLSLRYYFMNKNRDWNGSTSTPAEMNSDKVIRTNFYTVDFQTVLTDNWVFGAEMPMWSRYFSTVDDEGNPVAVNHNAIGDFRVTGTYFGLSEEKNSAITFGLKLPAGPFNQTILDRDTQIGTGTVDGLIGGHYMVHLEHWGYFGQCMGEVSFNQREGYRPGNTYDFSAGIYYDNFIASKSMIPMIQIVASIRGSDSGVNADPDNTGYRRLYLSPGLEVNLIHSIKFYGDIRIPLLTHVNGYQLVAPALFNLTVGYDL